MRLSRYAQLTWAAESSGSFNVVDSVRLNELSDTVTQVRNHSLFAALYLGHVNGKA